MTTDCAACGGTPRIINHLWWEGHEITLCAACFALGSVSLAESLTPADIEELLRSRANPNAARTGFEVAVRDWIAAQQEVNNE